MILRKVVGWIILGMPLLMLRAASQESLLDKVILYPGSYSQVCDVMAMPEDVPYQAFIISDFEGAGFSKANQTQIDKNREPLVKAIRARLQTLDFSRKATPPKEDPKPEENMDGEAFGCDPASLNPLLMRLIRQLHAIETLPELLLVEQKLVRGITKAKDDAKAAPPVVNGWFVGMEGSHNENEKENEAQRDRKANLFNARVAQRDLVMLMAVLMREKSYPAYIKTSIETAYAKGLKTLSKQGDLAKFKSGEAIPKELEHLDIEIDPITRLPRARYCPVKIPYTRESRDEVRAAAEKWVTEHP
jgi:hypothetical protein